MAPNTDSSRRKPADVVVQLVAANGSNDATDTDAPAQRNPRPRSAYPRRDIHPGGTYKRQHKKQWVKGSRVARRTGEGPWLPEGMRGVTQEEKDACLECVLPDCTEPAEGCAWTRVRAGKRAKR